MNKIVIPAILSIVILTAGFFAFAPVEKASTVHGTLASSAQLDGKDMVVPFSLNFSYVAAANTGPIEIVPAQTGVTYSGFFFLSAIPDHVTTTGADGATGTNFECGLSDGSGNEVSGTNATTGAPSSGILEELGSGEGIEVGIDIEPFSDGSAAFGGVCQGVIYLDENSG